MTETLADALPAEMARVRAKSDRWMRIAEENPEMKQAMALGLIMMAMELDLAAKAAASGDVAAMQAAVESLRGYSDDD